MCEHTGLSLKQLAFFDFCELVVGWIETNSDFNPKNA